MKKVVLSLAFVAAVLVSCKDKAADVPADTTMTEAVDTAAAAVDTAAAATEAAATEVKEAAAATEAAAKEVKEEVKK